MSSFLLNLARRSAGVSIGAPSLPEVSPVLVPDFGPVEETPVDNVAGDSELPAVEMKATETAKASILPRTAAPPPVEPSPHVGRTTPDSLAELRPQTPKSVEQPLPMMREAVQGTREQEKPRAAPVPATEPPLPAKLFDVPEAPKLPGPEPPAPPADPPTLVVESRLVEPKPPAEADRPELATKSTPIGPPGVVETKPSQPRDAARSEPLVLQPLPVQPLPEPLPMVVPAPTPAPETPLPPQPTARESESRPVQVRIGRIEVRAGTPRAPVSPPSPPAPAARGFGRYARWRTYSREEY